MPDFTSEELQLRNRGLPWAYGYELASAYALEAVTELRRAFNNFAERDPYETGKVERWDLSADAVQKDPVVQRMATTAHASPLSRSPGSRRASAPGLRNATRWCSPS
jgi:hypothetical protein